MFHVEASGYPVELETAPSCHRLGRTFSQVLRFKKRDNGGPVTVLTFGKGFKGRKNDFVPQRWDDPPESSDLLEHGNVLALECFDTCCLELGLLLVSRFIRCFKTTLYLIVTCISKNLEWIALCVMVVPFRS